MSVAIIPDFVKYQIEWLTSHKDLEFEPVIEDAIIQMLKDTGKSFIDEQAVETSQFDHTADIGKKVSIPCAHENDVISRKAVIDALHTWFRDGFDEDKWWNSTHVLTAIEGLPSAQPEIIRCKDCRHFNNGDCTELPKLVSEEDFCSFAERRTDG